MGKYRNKYRIASIRLQNWDYGWNGAYFVTICTKNRECYFGKIENNEMVFSKIGEYANKYWLEIPEHFKFVKLDVHVIMPNHVHGIILIDKTDDLPTHKSNVQTPNLGFPIDLPTHKSNVQTPNLGVSTSKKWKPGSLGTIINQYKRICTINARKIYTGFAWQPRFYEHIIRDQNSYQRIRNYIINNPKKWNLDKFNKQINDHKIY